MSNFQRVRYDKFPPVVKNLIIINALVWLAQQVFDKEYSLTGKLGLWPVQSFFFEPYQIVTHMFTHAPNTLMHILFNMLVLFMFGRVLENVWGGKRFLTFYLICGLGAAAAHLIMQTLMDGAMVPAVGASGAVMGVMVAFAFLFPNSEMYMMLIPIPIKAKYAIAGMIAIDLFGGFSNVPGDNIAHFAHLGGALTGFILVLIWNKTNRKTLY